MMVYKTPTREMQSTIHKGTKVISQGQEIMWSSFKARKMNWGMLTAQKSSSSNERSCLTLQMQMAMEMMLMKTSGTKT